MLTLRGSSASVVSLVKPANSLYLSGMEMSSPPEPIETATSTIADEPSVPPVFEVHYEL